MKKKKLVALIMSAVGGIVLAFGLCKKFLGGNKV